MERRSLDELQTDELQTDELQTYGNRDGAVRGGNAGGSAELEQRSEAVEVRVKVNGNGHAELQCTNCGDGPVADLVRQ